MLVHGICSPWQVQKRVCSGLMDLVCSLGTKQCLSCVMKRLFELPSTAPLPAAGVSGTCCSSPCLGVKSSWVWLVGPLSTVSCSHFEVQTCITSVAGRAFAWGMGTNYQLGTGEEDDVWSPVEMTGKQLENRTVLAVSSGGQHTVLLVKDKEQS